MTSKHDLNLPVSQSKKSKKEIKIKKEKENSHQISFKLEEILSGSLSNNEAFTILTSQDLLTLDCNLRQMYSKCWFHLIENLKTKELEIHRRILEICHSKIIPFVDQPFLLLDFLCNSYKMGGITSVLSLKSLFILIKDYNLDYPMFYHQLYQLLDENILHTKYREVLFDQMELFLSSSHIPAYMVAAFLKRLSRLSLSAPTAALMWIIPFVYNLIKRHPACSVLLHREMKANSNEEIRHESQKENIKELGNLKSVDCYDWNESIEKCGALESSLWELVAIKEHFYFKMSLRIKIIVEKTNKSCYKLEEYVSCSMEDFMQTEQGKKLKEPAPFQLNSSIGKLDTKEYNIF